MNVYLDAIWAWQATRPKVRPEWKFSTFEPEQLAQILEWQMSGLSNAKIAEIVQKEFGIPCRDSDLSGFWSQLSPFVLTARRRAAVEGANAVGKMIEETPADFDRATVELIKQSAFETLNSPEQKESSVKMMVGAFLKLRDQDAVNRRIALLEKQASQAVETVENNKLSDAEKTARLREIFKRG